MGYDVGDMSGMVFHRGLSHSLLMVPVIALIFAALWWFIRRKLLRKNTQDNRHPPTFRLLYACTFVAVLSHPLLDLLTSYGIQLFAPITRARYAIDTVAIIDVFYSSILIITLVACYVVRKVSRPACRTALIIGWAGFLLSCGYLAAGRALHNRAVNIARDLAGDVKIVRADAYPRLGSLLLWRTVVETPDSWQVAPVHHLRDFASNPPPLSVVPKVSNRWTRAARATEEFQTYNWFAMGRLRTTYVHLNGRNIVEFHDMRYSTDLDGTRSLWPLRVTLDTAGRVLKTERVFAYHRGRMGDFIRKAWREVWRP